MEKETIVQFVCFVTDHDLNRFGPEWENYAKRFINKRVEPLLQQQIGEAKTKFRYISKHEWPNSDFQFKFMNERRSEHFTEQSVKVVQAGGYKPLQEEKRGTSEVDDNKLIAFISPDETDIDSYRRLPLFRHLNIYQAYYENCTYGYVMEFFVSETDTNEFLVHLKQKAVLESGLYKECLVPHIKALI